jgi:phosphoglycerol transferase MdoB-like AlkP superfamily enzyme
MFKRLTFLAMYWLVWILCFSLFRSIFLIYHYPKAVDLGASLIAQTYSHGLRMDISFASYILMIPALLMSFTWKRWRWYISWMRGYSWLMALVTSIMVVVDLELFKAWGFRFDSTSLHYLETPREALASMGAAPAGPLFLLLLCLLFLVGKSLHTVVHRALSQLKEASALITCITFLAITGILVIPIRGGLQQIPMNESNAFFSDKSFANYAAINLPWNYASSLINHSYDKRNPYISFSADRADALVKELHTTGQTQTQLLKPGITTNVILIIWESFTAKVVRSLGGATDATPQFERLIHEGVLFSNMYASGNRSDKGMVAILSGYPSQPVQSIIKIPTKTSTLPSLPKSFKKVGYGTSFYYGGETEFANMKSYFLLQGFDRIIDKHQFAQEDMNSKWGAHDHVVLNRLLRDLDTEKKPFFTTLFTLSSHEPFEVPVKTAIPGNDTEHLFLNSHHYTDGAISDFIKVAKTKPWWSNTLIIIIADHGHPLPETPTGKLHEFHIPMLWLGGALEKTGVKIDSLCSQTDMATTVLAQLKLPASGFSWSNNVLQNQRIPFSYFAFNDGIGWVRPGGFIVRDNIGGHITEKGGHLSAHEIDRAKAYLQSTFADYLKR